MAYTFKLKDALMASAFRRITPLGSVPLILDTGGPAPDLSNFDAKYAWVPQSEFLRELYPQGHKILDPTVYKNDWIQVKEELSDGSVRKHWVEREVARVPVPFQYVIKTQQLIHVTGNDIVLVNSDVSPKQREKDWLVTFKQLWRNRNMNMAFFNAVDSEKCTGNTAIAFYFTKPGGKPKINVKVYSYLDGYTICDTIYSDLDGEPEIQAIKYQSYDAETMRTVEWVDLWDRKRAYRYRRNSETREKNPDDIYAGYDDGYTLISAVEHGYPNQVPVKVKRNRIGACWSPVQYLCDDYDIQASNLCQAARVLPHAVFFIKGGEGDVKTAADGRPTAIVTPDSQADAKFLTPTDTSGASDTALKLLEDKIFLGSFIVKPPEVKSGDLPGIAIKLIYAPSLDKAIADTKEWDPFVDGIVDLFSYGAAVEMGDSSLAEIGITGFAEPYIHQNVAEVVQNLVNAKQGGILSAETGTGKNPYSESDEYARVQAELKAQQEAEERQLANTIKKQ